MATPRTWREQMHALVAEIGADDGTDPRTQKKEGTPRGDLHRTRRLCGHVARTVGFLINELALSDLQPWAVDRVEPWPDGARLRVVLRPLPGQRPDPDACLRRLSTVQGWLRTELAWTIQRKRAPELVFAVEVES